MRFRSLVLSLASVVAVAAFSLLAATSATAATHQQNAQAQAKEPTRKTEQKTVKKSVKKSVKKTTEKKAVRKSTRKVTPAVKAAPTAAAKPSTDLERRLTRAGDYRFSIQHDELVRTYRVHVPALYDQAEPAPLLVALHGGGLDRLSDDGFDGLVRESDTHGFIAVYPDAWMAPGGQGKRAAWNAGHCCGDARERNVNDVGFVAQVVTNVFRQVSIDRERIYAAGVSDGAMMALRLACDLPDLFRGVASVGGAISTAQCNPGKPVSVLQFHARNDPRVPLASARATAVKWAELNGCTNTPRLVLEKAGAYCEAWTYCRRQSVVQMCVTDTGGHSWPGAKGRVASAAPSKAISATEAMWGFLISH